MKKVFFLLFLLCFFASCGRRQNNETDYNYENGYVFTLSIPTIMSLWITEAVENLENRLITEGIHVRFVIECYLPDERDVHFERKLGRFAAGIGPDIFVRDGFLIRPFTENGFIRDIHPLIEASENLSLDDFFVNALRAHEIGGSLYTMPMTFGFDFVGINSRVPRVFRDRFLEMTHVSIPELAALYSEMVSSDPGLSGFAFMNPGCIERFTPLIDITVDLTNKRVTFTEETIEYLNITRSVFENNNRFWTELILTHNVENLQMLQDRYIFFSPIGTSGGAEALFDFQTTFFTGFIPISNTEGELIDTSFGIELVVSSTAEEWLATAFIEEMLNVTGSSFDFAANSHIMRRYARQYLVKGLNTALAQFELRPIVGTQANAVARAAERVMELGEMPISRPLPHRYLPRHTFEPVLESLMAGGITAAEAANQIQSSIADFLAAEAVEITVYVPTPVVVRDGPTQTLRVLTFGDHVGVLEQAAEHINASWHAQDISYVFVLEADFWAGTMEAVQAQAARLAVELMAGDGPDMFMISGGFTDVRGMAERGFFADINALIENHPASSRSDFYENILDVLEIDGGLYIFPVSFGFHRIGINTSVPQPFVERFMGYEYISLSGLLDFYLDFMELHGHEYGHLVPGVPSFMRTPTPAVMHGMTPFIDFGRRTSNINSPRFADYLISLMRAFERHEFISNELYTNASNSFFMRNRQQRQLFDTGTFRGMAVEAILSRPEPFFANYIPITDDYGNFIFDITDHKTWGTWAITAAGDSALAWEFLTYVLEAYYAPTGRAAIPPFWGIPAIWANESIATPIKRAHFESRTRRVLEYWSSWQNLGYKHAPGSLEMAQEIDDAIRLMTAQNEMPVVHINPMFPPVVRSFLEEPIEQLRLGIITAETAALRIHNSITIWLLE